MEISSLIILLIAISQIIIYSAKNIPLLALSLNLVLLFISFGVTDFAHPLSSISCLLHCLSIWTRFLT